MYSAQLGVSPGVHQQHFYVAFSSSPCQCLLLLFLFPRFSSFLSSGQKTVQLVTPLCHEHCTSTAVGTFGAKKWGGWRVGKLDSSPSSEFSFCSLPFQPVLRVVAWVLWLTIRGKTVKWRDFHIFCQC